MNINTIKAKTLYIFILFMALLAGGLYYFSLHNYLLYYFCTELATIIIAFTIFFIGWWTLKIPGKNITIILAAGYLSVGAIDTLHILTFTGIGMPVYIDTNHATQFWISARYLEAITFLLAASYLARPAIRQPYKYLFGFAGACILFAYTIFAGYFPDSYFEGQGLTTFGVAGKYIISSIIIAAGIIFWKKREHLKTNILNMLLFAGAFTISSIISFAFYENSYSFLNYLGPTFKLFSFGLIFKILLYHSLTVPFQLLSGEVKEKAAQANLDKHRFLAKMSHEIRNPLNVIMGSNEMLSSNNLSFIQKEWTAMIKISAEALLNILNDVLDYSQAVDGRLCLNKLKFDLYKEVESVISCFNDQASEKGLHLSLDLKGEIPRKVVGDPDRIRQVISKLVENAIKYTRKGEVTVTLKPAKEGIEKAECGHQPECCTVIPIHFTVQDEGIGMSPEQVDILMQSPYQPDEQINNGEYNGPGLGLALSKKLVELMGGSIGITSALGSGTIFYFTIPFTLFKDAADLSGEPEAEIATLKEEPYKELKSLEILLVEDKLMNQKLAATILKNSGHRVTTANNGIEALELCRKRRFDLIFMDIQMPEMGGLEATTLIRALEKKENRRTPIIAITAYGMPEDQNKFLQAGMDYCLTKPVSSNDLYFVIAAVMEKFPDKTEKQDIALNEIREMLQRVEGNTELLEELMEMFFLDFHKDLAVMKNSLISRDAECVAFIAHGLKGDLSNLGMKSAFDIASELEIVAKENNFEKVFSLLELLKHEAKGLENFFSQDDWQKQI